LVRSDALAQSFKPARPVEVVVQSAEGGGADIFARLIAGMLEEGKLLSQPLRVVNNSRAAVPWAMAYLAERKGNDHTIGIFTDAWVATPLLREDAKYTVKDLTPLAHLLLQPSIVLVKTDSPYATLRDFIDAAKNSPTRLKQGGGPAQAIETQHGFLIQKATGVKWDIVSISKKPVKIADILSGNSQIIIQEPSHVTDELKSGQLRALVALTEKRISSLPDLSTAQEQGVDLPFLANGRGIMAPPGISKEAIEFWEELFSRMVKTPSWRKYLEETRVEPYFLKSRDFGQLLDQQSALMRSNFQEAGAKVVR
jgi:putative tricarboxylic transport membrane protein